MIGKSSALSVTEKLLRDNYSRISRDEDEDAFSAVESLIAHINGMEPIHSVLAETMRTIHRSFDFQSRSGIMTATTGTRFRPVFLPNRRRRYSR